ncbi:winged helix-turn-helix domain-containing protein [Halorubrum kocurii]|uniref:ArsR family transcriptional regulator n=1 Tax=Halorubrum kocurii JCM 14978 TaxID=1230456 RepID=M0NJC7_9EURY|nr:helix-turn-helix domain-containing protein [Halorubrum kocurii]EMA57653.1 hypothetical protein C468_16722 [Halorubrum kocurii JCM 14978]
MTDFDPEAAAAFDALGQEVRIGILEALVQERVDDPRSPGASFSELRERVGVSDSGRFNYHLDRLTGRFVQETDAGYELNAAGQKVVGAVLSRSFGSEGQSGPTALNAPCRACGETVRARYEAGKLLVECDNGHLNHSDYLPGSLVEERPLPEVTALAALLGQQDLDLVTRDVCPSCYRAIESGVVLEAGAPVLEAQCHDCGRFFRAPISLAVLTHPVLQAFYLERGRDVREASLWSLPFLTDSDRAHVDSESPLRVTVDASYDGDALRFSLNEDASVIEYHVERIRAERD